MKSTSVYFYAQRDSNYGTVNTVVPFNLIRTNVGNAMSTTGVFTAPRTGKYFFTYSGTSSGNNMIRVDLQLNGVIIERGIAMTTHDTFTNQATLQLSKGDQIRLFLNSGSIYDTSGEHFTNFVGFLLEENVF